jgi:hypothetical protein
MNAVKLDILLEDIDNLVEALQMVKDEMIEMNLDMELNLAESE